MRDPVPIPVIQRPGSEIAISASADGAILPVYAQPGARRSGIVGTHSRWLKVAVTQPPEKGKANEALIAVIADELGLKRSQVRLLSGESNRQKTFLLNGLSPEDLRMRLVDVLASKP